MQNLHTEYSLVVLEKHGGAFRNAYDAALPEAKPDVVFGDTAPWSSNQPEGIFVVENYNPSRGNATSQDKNHAIEAGIDHINSLGKNAVLYSWFATPAVTKVAQGLDMAPLIVARDEIICLAIEDKARLSAHLINAGCPDAHTPLNYTVSSAAGLPQYQDTRALFPRGFVIQGQSMGGDGTMIIQNEDEYRTAQRTLRGAVRVSEFVDAPYSSLYCMSIPTKDKAGVCVYVDGPSHKPVDIPDLGIGNVAGAGGDWHLPHEVFDMRQTTRHITQLADYFYQNYGYYGHFVVEGFVRDGQFLFNEVNARPCGGSEVNGTFQIDQGLPPFTILHLLSRLDRISSADLPDPQTYNEYAINRTVNGQPEGAYYLKYKNNTDQAVRPSADYKGSGTYKQTEGVGLVWSREGISSTAARLSENEIMITNGPAFADKSEVAAGKQICSIEGIIDSELPLFNDEKQIHFQLQPVVRALKNLFVEK